MKSRRDPQNAVVCRPNMTKPAEKYKEAKDYDLPSKMNATTQLK